MKKTVFKFLFTALALLSLFLLTGCDMSIISGISPESLMLDKAYTLNASINYGSSDEVLGSFSRESIGSWSGMLNEPFALQGYAAVYSGGTFSLNFSGLSIQLSEAEAGDSGIKLMLDALESGLTCGSKNRNNTPNTDSAGNNVSDVSIKTIGNSIEISGSNNNGTYILTLDKETRFPVSLSVPAHALNVDFTDVAAVEFRTSGGDSETGEDAYADFAEVAG